MINKIQKVRRILQKDGPVPLVSRTGEHIRYRIWKDIMVPFCQSVVSDEKLVSRNQLWETADITIPVGQAETFQLKAPRFPADHHDKISNRVGDHSLEQPFVCEIPDATLVGEKGVTLTRDGGYILENSRSYPKKLYEDLTKSFRLSFHSKPDQTIDHAVSLVGPYHTGYYHWFVDYLSRLRGVREYQKKTGEMPTILVPPNLPKWKQTSLKLLNYWDHCSVWKGGTAEVKRLVIPTFAHSGKGGTLLSPSRLNWVRAKMTNSVEQSDSKGYSKYIYISRNDAKVRRVHNEPNLLETLPDKFESYMLSNMRLVDQIELFSNAEMVVAPHGAGLTNMLWGIELDVLELRRARDPDCYFQMASALDHTYNYLKCKEQDKNIIVDLANLSEHIE